MGLFDKVFKSDRKKRAEKRPEFAPVAVTADNVAKNQYYRYREEPWMYDLPFHMRSNKERSGVVCTVKGANA